MTSKKRTSKQTTNNNPLLDTLVDTVKSLKLSDNDIQSVIDSIVEQHSPKPVVAVAAQSKSKGRTLKEIQAFMDNIEEPPATKPTKSKKAPKKIKRVADAVANQEQDDDAIQFPKESPKRKTKTDGPDTVATVDPSGTVVITPLTQKQDEPEVVLPKMRAVVKDGCIMMTADED
jgi:uncharacterized membrane-anchored protein YjiN (DUF445 family)